MTLHITPRIHKKHGKYYLRWTDERGRDRVRTARTRNRREAEKKAVLLEIELNSEPTPGSILWEDFREEFEAHKLQHASKGYRNNVRITLDWIEDNHPVVKIGDINTRWLDQLARKASGKAIATINKYFQHIRTALNWARTREYIRDLPVFPARRSGGKHMKGRPLDEAEFAGMLDVTPRQEMKALLQGLWLSGLRLGEALQLTWDQWSDGIRILIEGEDVFLLIDSHDQKNRKTVTYPVVPDFAEFLLRTPVEQRQGFVFHPTRFTGGQSRRIDTVSRWIVEIGRTADIKVDVSNDGRPVWASAHDFRRAFGFRWASLVMPLVLKELMRHASVATTEKFYVGINARRTLDAVKDAMERRKLETTPS